MRFREQNIKERMIIIRISRTCLPEFIHHLLIKCSRINIIFKNLAKLVLDKTVEWHQHTTMAQPIRDGRIPLEQMRIFRITDKAGKLDYRIKAKTRPTRHDSKFFLNAIVFPHHFFCNVTDYILDSKSITLGNKDMSKRPRLLNQSNISRVNAKDNSMIMGSMCESTIFANRVIAEFSWTGELAESFNPELDVSFLHGPIRWIILLTKCKSNESCTFMTHSLKQKSVRPQTTLIYKTR